jgi:hypothetical protein
MFQPSARYKPTGPYYVILKGSVAMAQTAPDPAELAVRRRAVAAVDWLQKNADGSVDVYFGPTALAGDVRRF